MDCYLSQHSASSHWTSASSIDFIVSVLKNIINDSPNDDDVSNTDIVTRLRWLTKSEKATFLSSNALEDVSTTGDGTVTMQFLRVTGKVGFRDLHTFVISTKKSTTTTNSTTTTATTTVQGSGRSLDYHMWTACPCCFGGGCRYVACFFCCCGVCPTKDWGQNERTMEEIMTRGMKYKSQTIIMEEKNGSGTGSGTKNASNSGNEQGNEVIIMTPVVVGESNTAIVEENKYSPPAEINASR